MPVPNRPHLTAVSQALLVVCLWATSWVLMKVGLRDIPALTFAGLRYALAALCVLPFALRGDSLAALRGMGRSEWLRLALFGLLQYTITQGAAFVGLVYLPAATVNMVFSLTSVLVALLALGWLSERPSAAQWAGVGVYAMGIGLYFFPVDIPPGAVVGVLVVGAGTLAGALSSVIGRAVNRTGHLPPLAVTAASMCIGSAALLAAGVVLQGVPPISPANVAIIVWLAVVNTAFAFTLWNHTLRTLTAIESSLINSGLLILIPILAWIFLGEVLAAQDVLAIVVTAAGIVMVQVMHR
jgi:drug/metabolite transporter (DMT)-like permease